MEKIRPIPYPIRDHISDNVERTLSLVSLTFGSEYLILYILLMATPSNLNIGTINIEYTKYIHGVLPAKNVNNTEAAAVIPSNVSRRENFL